MAMWRAIVFQDQMQKLRKVAGNKFEENPGTYQEIMEHKAGTLIQNCWRWTHRPSFLPMKVVSDAHGKLSFIAL